TRYMTVAMSSEGDSAKSALSESNEKSGTDNNTDSSQDSHDVTAADAKDEKAAKAPVENDVEKKTEPDKPKEEAVPDNKPEEKKVEAEENEKKEDDKKVQAETEEVDSKDSKKDKEEKEEPKKEEASDKEEEEDEEDESKKEVPLLDQPLEMSGKRERKNVQRLEIASEVKETKIEFDGGSGTPLGDIARVDASISRFKNDDLKLLHRLLFKVPGKNTQIKKNIRKFNGFDFKKDSEEYTKKVAFAHKFETKHLKSICEMLDLTKSGTKDDIIERVMDFLIDPKDTGRGRPKRTAAVKANNRGYSSHDDFSSDERQSSRARRDKGKRTNLKDDSSSDEEFQPNQSDGSEDRPRLNKRKRKSRKKDSSEEEEEEEESEASVGSSDESDDEPKTKRKKSVSKANSRSKAKSTPGRRGRPPAATRKPPSRGKKPKDSSEEEEDEESDQKDESSSSEDEPLAKKAKNSQPPTDEEIKTFIKSILEGANLEEITMKTVCQRVYGNYPDFDLTHKKDFIKSTVKSVTYINVN
ncbi:hypothetical protein NQ315_009881, partial [Exocentrus adspersus]